MQEFYNLVVEDVVLLDAADVTALLDEVEDRRIAHRFLHLLYAVNEEVVLFAGDQEYRNAVVTFTRFGGEVCEFYDLLYENCLKKIRSVRNYLEGFTEMEAVDTNLNLSLTLTGAAWDEVMKILEKELKS